MPKYNTVPIIVLHGKSGVGKDPFAKAFADNAGIGVHTFIFSFAGPVREIIYQMLGIEYYDYAKQKDSKPVSIPMPGTPKSYTEFYVRKSELLRPLYLVPKNWYQAKQLAKYLYYRLIKPDTFVVPTYRELMLMVGRFGQRVNMSVWANAMLRQLDLLLRYDNTEAIIISDLRFPMEIVELKNYAERLKDFNVHLIFVNLKRQIPSKDIHQDASETELEQTGFQFDYEIILDPDAPFENYAIELIKDLNRRYGYFQDSLALHRSTKETV